MSFLPLILKNIRVRGVFLSSLFLSAHYFLIIYASSLFIEGIFSTEVLGNLYITGSILNAILLLSAPRLVQKYGVFSFYISLIVLEVVAVLLLTLNPSPGISAGAFLVHLSIVFMIFYGLDLFLETVVKKEDHTGLVRGIYLTIANAVLVCAPTVTFFILGDKNNFALLYGISLALILPLVPIAYSKFKKLRASPPETDIAATIKVLSSHPDILRISMVQLALQSFYAWMVIYMPIYLSKTIGFTNSELGPLFTIMLLPFVLLSIPVGEAADKLFGEKEFIVVGFVILAITIILMPTITTPTFFLWATILFSSRVGASIVEAACESYFFKKVRGRDAHIISFYRLMRPFAFVIFPILAGFTLKFMTVGTVFLGLSILMCMGLGYAVGLKDTR